MNWPEWWWWCNTVTSNFHILYTLTSNLLWTRFLHSLPLQAVGPNSSGDVRGLRQQDAWARTVPPIHTTALDHGASSILRHGDEEPRARRGALNSRGVGRKDATDEHGLCCAVRHACEDTGRRYRLWKASACVITGTSLLWDQPYVPSTRSAVDILSECSRDLVCRWNTRSFLTCSVSAPFPSHWYRS